MQRSPPSAALRERGPLPASAGIGLRFPHHRAIAETRPAIGWLEVHSENYMGGGTTLRQLETIREHYPISLHGVGLSLGSAGALDPAHLRRVKGLVERVQPALVSEHLSWSSTEGTYLADLLPLPMTEEALDVMCRHVDQLQTILRRRVLIENPSSYLRYRHSTIPEWEFLAAVSAGTGCGILCDVNNVYVSCCNHGWDAPRLSRSAFRNHCHRLEILFSRRSQRQSNCPYGRVHPHRRSTLLARLRRGQEPVCPTRSQALFGVLSPRNDRMGHRYSSALGVLLDEACIARVGAEASAKRATHMPTLLELLQSCSAAALSAGDTEEVCGVRHRRRHLHRTRGLNIYSNNLRRILVGAL
jgi:hypothetical protein